MTYKSTVKVGIPESINKYAPLLADFFDGMIKKLDKNSHKDTPTMETLDAIMDLLLQEILEFKHQVKADRLNENSLIELMDQANFSFLAYVALRLEGAEHETRIHND